MVTQTTSSVHLIGIGGTGLSAIARVLFERGYTVSGSDRQLSPLAASLRQAGVRVAVGHAAENVRGADLVIRSSAVPDDNVEVQAARKMGIPVEKRADFLGKLMADSKGIAIAGTHGKTTTTAMIAWALTALSQEPSFIIGGVATNMGTNARAGSGAAFVIEADEYDRMFLGLEPEIAVVTNLEHDHPDCYATPDDFYQAFLDFAARLSPDGLLLACGDDPGAARLLADAARRGQEVASYGIRQAQYAYIADNLQINIAGAYTFDAACSLESELFQPVTVALQVPGVYNVRNALAALAVIHRMGLPAAGAVRALESFQGTGRRFELLGEAGEVAVIDDYAHHPTEIRATLTAARTRYPDRKLWAVWQPHTYSRTRLLFNEFVNAFVNANHVLVTDVYASREPTPTDGFSARQVVAAMEHPDAHYVPDLKQATSFLLSRLEAGDVLLVMSAGDADQISSHVLAALKDRQMKTPMQY